MLEAHAWMVTLKGFRLTVTHPFSSTQFSWDCRSSAELSASDFAKLPHRVVGRQVNGVSCLNQCDGKQLQAAVCDGILGVFRCCLLFLFKECSPVIVLFFHPYHFLACSQNKYLIDAENFTSVYSVWNVIVIFYYFIVLWNHAVPVLMTRNLVT